jgi:hypothetical protein
MRPDSFPFANKLKLQTQISNRKFCLLSACHAYMGKEQKITISDTATEVATGPKREAGMKLRKKSKFSWVGLVS